MSGREAILEATLRVIEARGADAVTHRAVAAEAGVSPALTTYHFAGKDALVSEALAIVIDRSVGQVTELLRTDGPITRDELAERLLALAMAQLADREAPLLAQFELSLEASRRPALRPLAERWDEAYSAALSALAQAAGLARPQQAAAVLSALMEGALLAVVSLPDAERGEEFLHPLIRRGVAGL